MAKLARFELYPDVTGTWRFRLIGANNEVIASGEGFDSKWNAKRATRALRLAAITARTVEGTS